LYCAMASARYAPDGGWLELCCRAVTPIAQQLSSSIAGSDLSKNFAVAWLIFTALLAMDAGAQSTIGISVKAAIPRPLSLQVKVDRLFERGEYERAYLIYRNELAPLGDKYAQYMVGYMHLTGMGAERDPALASAWYRLAAERGTPEFIALRDQVMQELPAEQLVQSDALYRQLRHDYSDLAVLLRSIKHHVHELQARAGTGVTGTPASITVFKSQTSMRTTAPTAVSYARIRIQLRDQLRKLAVLGNFADLETDPSKVDVDQVERLVNERIAATAP